MVIVRIALLLGLVIHKLLWEALKPTQSGQRGPSLVISLPKRAVKGVKVAALGGIILQTLFLNVFPIFRRPKSLRVIGMAIYLVGLAMAIAGRLQLGKNWANIEDYQVTTEQQLVRNGLYGYVRHPIYAGDILMLMGLELTLNSWLVLASLVPLLVVFRQSKVEEALLALRYPDYHEYRVHTKRFVPFIV